jgi:hypothetical protein
MLLDRSFAHPGFWICEKFTQILDAWMHKSPISTLRLFLIAGILHYDPLDIPWYVATYHNYASTISVQ